MNRNCKENMYDLYREKRHTASEEAELFEKAMAGDDAAKKELFEGCLFDIYELAEKQYRQSNYTAACTVDELVSEGYNCLVENYAGFNPANGNKLMTYLKGSINAAISTYLYSAMHGIDTDTAKHLKSFNTAKAKLEEKGLAVTSENLMKELGCNKKQLMDYYDMADFSNPLSFDRDNGEDENEDSLYNIVKAPEETDNAGAMADCLNKILELLPETERKFMGYYKDYNFNEVAKKTGMKEKDAEKLYKILAAKLRGTPAAQEYYKEMLEKTAA